jgi:hypothetical protein
MTAPSGGLEVQFIGDGRLPPARLTGSPSAADARGRRFIEADAGNVGMDQRA